jgi:hypothetical protein
VTPFLRSPLGYALALGYLAIAGFVVHSDLVHRAGGWISLPGMGTFVVTLPSQATLGWLLRQAGVPPVNFDHPGLAGYAQLTAHLLLTSALLYAIGFGIVWGIRRL